MKKGAIQNIYKARLLPGNTMVDNMYPQWLSKKILLIGLFLLLFVSGASLMLYYVYKDPFVGHGDSANTAVVARNLAQGKGYTVDFIMHFFIDYQEISHPEDTWPLGLPTFVAVFFKIFGSTPFVAKLPNLLLFLAFILAMFFFLLKKYNMFIAFFASIFTLFNLNIFNWLKEPSNDIDFLIFVNLAIVCIAFWVVQPKNKYLLLTGIFTALSLLFKQTGLLLIPLFVFIIIIKQVRNDKEHLTKSIIRNVLLFLFITLIFASPWLMRNMILFGDPLFSLERKAGILIGGAALQDESYRVLFDESDIQTLTQPTMSEKIVFTFKEWYYFGRSLIKDNIVPSVLLFFSLFALLLLTFNDFEQNLVRIHISFILFYLLFIISYWHVEARYFLFAIPPINFLSAKLLYRFYEQISQQSSKLVFFLILIFLLFSITFPFLSDVYYGSKELENNAILKQISFVENNTPNNAVIMTRAPAEITYHTQRKTVMIPFGNTSDFYTIIKKYNVTHVFIADPLWYYATHLQVRPWVYDINRKQLVGKTTQKSIFFNETVRSGDVGSIGCLYFINFSVINKEEEIEIIEVG